MTVTQCQLKMDGWAGEAGEGGGPRGVSLSDEYMVDTVRSTSAMDAVVKSPTGLKSSKGSRLNRRQSPTAKLSKSVDISDPNVFWKSRLSYKPSTFGTSEKMVRPATPPDIIPERSCDAWAPFERSGQAKGRVRVNISMGGLLVPDGSGVYDPKPFVISSKRNGQKYTLSGRQPLRGPPKGPAPNAYTLKPGFVFTPPYVELMTKESGRNSAPVRNRHLGPGTYELDGVNKISNYERVLDPKLKPKGTNPVRPTIANTNLFIKEHYNTDVYDQTDRADSPGPGEYDVSADPRKIVLAKTMGYQFPIGGQKEGIKPGPGDYDLERANRLGGHDYLSSPNRIIPLLKPLINPSADPDTMTDTINKRVWAKYKSEYSFPKKILPRLKKGQVFYSTVQDMPQYHAGKHSSGAHIKLERR
jgi:hypothetical protein